VPPTVHSIPNQRAHLAPYLRLAAVLLTAASVFVLLRFPPGDYTFYPRCPIFTYFHLLCPGCGATRALAAVLRGHLREAFHLNPLTTLLLPLALRHTIRHQIRKIRNPEVCWPQPPAYAVYGLLVITTVFTIARNLPL